MMAGANEAAHSFQLASVRSKCDYLRDYVLTMLHPRFVRVLEVGTAEADVTIVATITTKLMKEKTVMLSCNE